MSKHTATMKPNGRDGRGRFSAGNSAAAGRKPIVAKVEVVLPITLESLIATMEADAFDAFLAEELQRLTRLGEALT